MTTPRRLATVFLALILMACAGQPPAPEIHLARQSSAKLEAVLEAASGLARQVPADEVLVAFDLDNTLLAMQQQLGADQWYEWQRQLGQARPCDPATVADRLAAQGALYHSGAMRPTEAGIGDLLERLRQAGHPTLIVTARGADFRLSTFRELRRNNLNFRDFSPGPKGGSGHPFTLAGSQRQVLYEDGVLQLAGQHKGHMLVALLNYLEVPLPAAVVFVDDKQHNIDAMGEGLEAAGIGGHLILYTGEAATVAAFDPAAAAAAWHQLEPALQTVEAVMGPYNHDLPPAREDCQP